MASHSITLTVHAKTVARWRLPLLAFLSPVVPRFAFAPLLRLALWHIVKYRIGNSRRWRYVTGVRIDEVVEEVTGG